MPFRRTRYSRRPSFPFHVLDNNQAMNVRPKNYSWPEICAHTIDLRKYAFSWRSRGRRLAANQGLLTRLVYEALRHCSHWDAPPHYPPLPARGP